MLERHYKISELVEALGLTEDTIKTAIKRGFLKAKKAVGVNNGVLLIAQSDLDAWLRPHNPAALTARQENKVRAAAAQAEAAHELRRAS